MAATEHDLRVNRRMTSGEFIDHVNRKVECLRSELAMQHREIETLRDDKNAGWYAAGVLLIVVIVLLGRWPGW